MEKIEHQEPPIETLLLIHGTGAAALEDEGPRWWQKGSEVWNQLQSRLVYTKVRLPDQAFHWTGENLETERRFAGHDLFEKWLLPLEIRRQPYHLVGHSHGGSVIWEALLMAARLKIDLKYLKTWTTVGTPFLQYRGIFAGLSALLLSAHCLLLFVLLHWLLCAAYVAADLDGPTSLSVGERLTTEVLAKWSNSFKEASWATFALLIGVPLGVALLPYFRAVSRRRLQRKAMAAYGERWLGIRSRADEAIGALESTLVLHRCEELLGGKRRLRIWQESMNEMRLRAEVSHPHGQPWRRRLLSWAYSLGYRSSYVRNSRWMLYLILYSSIPALRTFDYMMRRAARRALKLVAARMQGNDGMLYGAVAHATPGPLPTKSPAYQSLPDDMEKALGQRANQECLCLVEKLRGGFGQIALGAVALPTLLSHLGKELTWRELVHTSYFDNPDVLELLALHIETTLGEKPHEVTPRARELSDWLSRFKQGVREHVLNEMQKK